VWSAFVRSGVAAFMVGTSSIAIASDTLKFGPPPSWVVPAHMPAPAKGTSDAPFTVLLSDQQFQFERGKITTFSEAAIKIQTPQGLAAGNVSIPWNPATDEVTVNKLVILRGGQVIDVLANQKFTTIRRESNLEAAVLDGRLTATIQPEDLREGDIVSFAATIEHVDPVMQNHVEANFGMWNGTPIGVGQVRLVWPTDMKLNIRESDALPKMKTSVEGGKNIAYLKLEDIQPLLAPKGAPPRFQLGRIADASDFASWSDVAALMIPLFEKAAVVPPSGPLRDEVERIRKETSDPAIRAEMALALVQDRVRYVALLMGEGGYVPTSAETTWSQRLGDCKAKTALLTALLRELGIEATPVMVRTGVGDAIPGRLPMLGAFDHVLARARIGGKYYWLDGTRTGDTKLDRVAVPDFRWGLPLVARAELIPIVPAALTVPEDEQKIEIDATAGLLATSSVTIDQVYRGDSAIVLNSIYAQLSSAQRDELIREGAKRLFDGLAVTNTSVQFDKVAGQLHQVVKGEAKLEWDDGWFYIPSSSIGSEPDFDRASGPLREAPFAVSHPAYEKRRVTIRLPAGLAAKQKPPPPPIKETLAGVEYERRVEMAGDVLRIETSERSIASEVAYKEALAAAPRLKAINGDDIYLRLPDDYRATEKDVAALQADKPASTADFMRRGHLLLDRFKFDEAIADFNEALKQEPNNKFALASRAIGLVWKQDYDAAEKDLAKLQALDPKNAVAWRARGLMAEQKGDYQVAVDAYSEALRIEPSNNFAIGHRAYAFNGLDATEQALADSAAALKADPSWRELRLLRANIFARQGNLDAAGKEADLLVAESPQNDFAQVAAARIYARIGRTDDAMKAFDRAIAIKPQGYIFLNRAQSRPFIDYAGRLADLDEALKLEPESPFVLAEKAEQLAVTGKLAEALQLYDRAVRSEPQATQLVIGRAGLLYKAGKIQEAEKAFAEVRSRAKTASDFNSLCWAKATRAILIESALEDCRQALKLKPDAGAYLDSLGMVMLRLGRLDEALTAYDKAVAKSAGSASFMGRALVYARKGDKAHASADRAEALKLDPDAEARFSEFGLKL
jgi:tetratricopeptide (TPR) repeat protein